ncbi:hypothetical protein HLB44_13560 [Aquincola sp. S2]|uniref:Uncharacterized protein n=1 Tax=Pseudaquabacterium terrae TaxID=2732868 RepID=A0ABX2EHA5_9BURK|nr:hypothetical protein [Aquabacterium terrae]NRF68015.1 hypothetical protein [Aquabacterium terrae]
MNSIDASARLLVDWVDLKWLMAAEGRSVDLDRLTHDPLYAAQCCEVAMGSAQPALRRVALRLRAATQAAV